MELTEPLSRIHLSLDFKEGNPLQDKIRNLFRAVKGTKLLRSYPEYLHEGIPLTLIYGIQVAIARE